MEWLNGEYKPVKLLGEGTFGRVFLCTAGRSKKLVCIKRICLNHPHFEKRKICNEIYILSQLHHPRIIQFIRSFVHMSSVNIVMEFAFGGTLRDVISNREIVSITPKRLLKYFCDILMGVEYLHIRHVVHRDIKPENILLDAKDRVKIADFGIAFIHSNSIKQLKPFGTPYYTAPEILQGMPGDFKSDIWSLGCVIYEMCFGSSPFAFATTMEELCTFVLRRPSMHYSCRKLSAIYGPVWGSLCENMLSYEPAWRMPITSILCFDELITVPYYSLYFDYDYKNPNLNFKD